MSHKSFLKRFFEAPARLLDEGVTEIKREEQNLIGKHPMKRAEEYWDTLGPGLTTGASDDDPSGIATYSQAGARYGFGLLWLSWFSFPLMAVVQEMCARIGVVTGRGLAANIRKHYPRWALYMVTALLFLANTFNIGADLGAMARGVQLLRPEVSFAFLVILLAAISLSLQIFTTYARYARYLKYLALVLFAYVFSALLSGLDWKTLAQYTVTPSVQFTREQIYLICGILGTTISPYLFFWQTAQEVEEEHLRAMHQRHTRAHMEAVHHARADWHRDVPKKAMRRLRTDVWSGMFFSNLVMFFIIAASAGELYAHGITNIATVADAALALRPFAGDAAFLFFAIGIVGTGMLAIPVLAGSTSYAISESFGWKYGLYRKLKEAYAFYGVIIVSVVLGIILNFSGLDPVKTLVFAAVANGVISPIILVFVVRLSGSREVMRGHANGTITSVVGWATIGLMAISGVAAILTFLW